MKGTIDILYFKLLQYPQLRKKLNLIFFSEGLINCIFLDILFSLKNIAVIALLSYVFEEIDNDGYLIFFMYCKNTCY